MVKGVLFVVHVDASKRQRNPNEIQVEEWLDFRGTVANEIHNYATTKSKKRLAIYFEKEPEVPDNVLNREEILTEFLNLTEKYEKFSKKFFELYKSFLFKFLIDEKRIEAKRASLQTLLGDAEIVKMIFYGMGVSEKKARKNSEILIGLLLKMNVSVEEVCALQPVCLSFHPLPDTVQDDFLLYLLEQKQEFEKVKEIDNILKKVRYWKRFLDLAAKEVRRMYRGIRKIVEIAEQNEIQVIFLPGGDLKTMEYRKSPYALAKIIRNHLRGQPNVGFHKLRGYLEPLQKLHGKLPVFLLGCYAELCITTVDGQLEEIKPKLENKYLFTWPYTIFAYEEKGETLEELHKKKGFKIINIKKFKKIVKEL